MTDYFYPSIYFGYFFFFLMFCGAVFFFLRSFRDGYWGASGEDVKYHMLDDDEKPDSSQYHLR